MKYRYLISDVNVGIRYNRSIIDWDSTLISNIKLKVVIL